MEVFFAHFYSKCDIKYTSIECETFGSYSEHVRKILIWLCVTVTGPEAYKFIKKETLAHVFSWEFSKIFKSTYFEEHLWTTASGCRLENQVEIEP